MGEFIVSDDCPTVHYKKCEKRVVKIGQSGYLLIPKSTISGEREKYMVRPKKNRIVESHPEVTYFKPRGVPQVSLEEVCMTVDELKSIRLSDLLGLSYEDAGKHMDISGLPSAGLFSGHAESSPMP